MEDIGGQDAAALLSDALVADHHHVLKGGQLEEDIPSDLLDSALLDDHAPSWRRAGLMLADDPHDLGLSNTITGTVDSSSCLPDPPALQFDQQHSQQHLQNAQTQVAGHALPQEQHNHPSATGPPSLPPAATSGLDMAGLLASTGSAVGSDDPDSTHLAAEQQALSGLPEAPAVLPSKADAPAVDGLVAEPRTAAPVDALLLPAAGPLQHTNSSSSGGTDGEVPDMDEVPAPSIRTAGAAQQQHRNLQQEENLKGGDEPPPPPPPQQQQQQQESLRPAVQEALPQQEQMTAPAPLPHQGGEVQLHQQPQAFGSQSAALDHPLAGQPAQATPAAAAAAGPSAAGAGAAAGAGDAAAEEEAAGMFASVCSSWHTCASASSSSSVWRSVAPVTAAASGMGANNRVVQQSVLAGGGQVSAAGQPQPAAADPLAGVPPPAAAAGAALVVSNREPPSVGGLPAGLQGAEAAAAAADNGPGSDSVACSSGLQLEQQQQPGEAVQSTEALASSTPAATGAASTTGPSEGQQQEASSAAAPAANSSVSAESAAAAPTCPAGQVHPLLPCPPPLGPPAATPAGAVVLTGPGSSSMSSGTASMLPGGGPLLPMSTAGYPLASMVMRESQLEDISLSMSLARDPWAAPAHSMAPVLPPAAARAVRAAALALTESSYSSAAAASTQRGSSNSNTAAAGQQRRTANRAGGTTGWGYPGAATAAAGSSAWRIRQHIWAVPGALQQLGQQAAAAARGVVGTAAAVAGLPVTPVTCPPPAQHGAAAVTASTVLGDQVTEEGAVLVPPVVTGPASSLEFEEERGMVLVQHSTDMPQSLEEMEAELYRGLLYVDGRDSHGRPVLVVDVDRIPAGPNGALREAALSYLLRQAMPLVCQGAYVLVLVASQAGPPFGLLPSWWCLRTYRSLSRPFKKHVRHVVLVQPNMFVRAILTLVSPFLSPKAHAKIKQVDHLLDIERATCGEVQVAHLGESFLAAVQRLPTFAGPR